MHLICENSDIFSNGEGWSQWHRFISCCNYCLPLDETYFVSVCFNGLYQHRSDFGY